MLSKNQKITLAGGAGNFNFTDGNGAPLATVRVSHQSGGIDLDFQFNQALAAAEIGAIAVARTQRIELLNLTATKLAPEWIFGAVNRKRCYSAWPYRLPASRTNASARLTDAAWKARTLQSLGRINRRP